jgi:hypothetical protein
MTNWDAAFRSLRETDRRFSGAYGLNQHLPDDADSKNLWNAGKFLPDYKLQQPEDSPLQISSFLCSMHIG